MSTTGRRGRPPKPGRGSKRIELSCDESRHEDLKMLAESRGMKVAELLHALIDHELKTHPPEVLRPAS